MRSIQYNPKIRSRSVIDRYTPSRNSSPGDTPQQTRAFKGRDLPAERHLHERPSPEPVPQYSKSNGHLRNDGSHLQEVRICKLTMSKIGQCSHNYNCKHKKLFVADCIILTFLKC